MLPYGSNTSKVSNALPWQQQLRDGSVAALFLLKKPLLQQHTVKTRAWIQIIVPNETIFLINTKQWWPSSHIGHLRTGPDDP